MHSQARALSSLFRPICLAIIAALLMAVGALSAWAQNSVPPTAVQAAKMPEFASRLAHPVRPQASRKPLAPNHRRPLDSNDIYDNGPTNGNTDAWTINFGYVVSDSFNVANDNTSVTGMTFAAWLLPGDTLGSAEVSITSSENGGTSYFDQTVTFSPGACTANDYGYNVCNETTSFTGPTLNAGTYWVNLQNASVSSGDPVYWDENSGPSSAYESSIGTIPSESFTILGNATTSTTSTTWYDYYACPSPQPGFHDLHDFSPNAGPSGLAIDTAGKLYGSFANGGSYGAGLLYDFAQRAGHWFLTSLDSFLGGSNGSSPNGVIVGPEGVPYGAATGGIQACGSDGSSYCGVIYEARPGPTACATASCGWNETTIYQFTGNTDAWAGSVTAFDSAGNLYGISSGGLYQGSGANGAGAVFELTPSQGGWTEKIIYNFPGGNHGAAAPNSLLIGQDGNLYGTAQWGPNGFGVVFQLAPSGGAWTENILYAFTGTTDGSQPAGLVQDPSGNLYGFSICDNWGEDYCGYLDDYYGLIFSLQPSGSGWIFNVIYSNWNDCDGYKNLFNALTVGAGGLYAAEGGDDVSCLPGGNCYGWHCGKIIAVGSHTPLVAGDANIFWNITSDANGKLYGTTGTCGFGTLQRTDGMIWQYSP